jgi:hypothetical protein
MPRLEKASRVVTAVWRVLAEQLELVEEHGVDLDVAALWRAVESGASREYADLCAELGVRQSMGAVGSSADSRDSVSVGPTTAS